MNRADYPPNWESISIYIRFFRALGRCEGSPRFPDCHAANRQPHPVTGSIVMLTTAHIDHDTTNNHPHNLRAMCQRCHLTHDAHHHARNAANTRRRKKLAAGQLEMIL